MKIIKGDIMKSDMPVVVYLSRGKAAEILYREHPAIYNWLFPKNSFPPGSILITARPDKTHVILFAEDEYGGIRADDLYQCLSDFKEYIETAAIDESTVGISLDLIKIIKERDYIKE